MKPICLNLSDGTIVIGVEHPCLNSNSTDLENVLLITSTSYINKTGTYNPQIYLTKYNLFGDNKIMSFNNNTIISKYIASDALNVYYNSFLKSMEDDPDDLTNIENLTSETPSKSFLSEFEDIAKDSKIDIENLRNTVQRSNIKNSTENDDFPNYENDDDDEDDENY